jgi:hypothetical protein
MEGHTASADTFSLIPYHCDTFSTARDIHATEPASQAFS